MYILNPEKSSGIRTHARKNAAKTPSGKTSCDCTRLISPSAEEETGEPENQKIAITFAFSVLRGILYFTFFFCKFRRDG